MNRTPLSALYFDGRSAQGQAVRLLQQGNELVVQPSEPGQTALRWPLDVLQWPERTRHGQRVLRLPGGGEIACADARAFDTWRAGHDGHGVHGAHESWVVRAQQQWRGAAAAMLLLVLVLVSGYLWGLPWVARTIVVWVPPTVDVAIGEAAYDSIRARWLKPTRLSAERQAALRALFQQALRPQAGNAAQARGTRVPWQLHFHAGGEALGANAFALPGGTIVVTDELVVMLEGHDDTLLGVLGHEWGHVQRRHGMRALAQVALIGLVSSLVLGDFSSVAAGAPAILGQLGYSRDAEREADADAAQLLHASGRSPAVMVVLFEKLAARNGDAGGSGGSGSSSGSRVIPLALASHPVDAERIAFFRAAAAQPPR